MLENIGHFALYYKYKELVKAPYSRPVRVVPKCHRKGGEGKRK